MSFDRCPRCGVEVDSHRVPMPRLGENAFAIERRDPFCGIAHHLLCEPKPELVEQLRDRNRWGRVAGARSRDQERYRRTGRRRLT